MPIAPTYPGVYVEEIPSGVRTITGVATSITAFLGRARRGPVNRAMEINSYGDFERLFGGLWPESTLGYAVRDFYLNGGSKGIIVRLFSPTFADEAARAAAETAATPVAQTAADAISTAATAAVAGAVNPQAVATAARGAVAAAGAPGPAALAAAEAVAAAAEGAVAAAATPQTVADAATAAKAGAVTAAAKAAAPVTRAGLAANGLALEAAAEGAWANELRVRIDWDTAGPDKATTFNLAVRDGSTGNVEIFRNLSMTVGNPRQIDKVLLNESQLLRMPAAPSGGRPAAHPDPAPGQNVWADPRPGTADTVTNSKVTTVASDGIGIVQANFDGVGLEGKKEGLYALEQADLFNLLSIPPYKSDGDVDGGLLDAAAKYCEQRRAFFLIDPPVGWKSKDQAKSGIDSLQGLSKNAAVFFPRLRQINAGQKGDFVPSGAVAGIFARTDTARGVWKAPAGLDATLVGVPELSVPLTDPENGDLNPRAVNCLRTLPASGRVVWGARTRVGDDRTPNDWKYIPVRRLALYIEESLYRGTHWVVFEPNDEPLWGQIRLSVGAFMHNLFRKGAFQGSAARDAYFVKCDKETNPQNDIDLGIVNILVGFAPLKPAEFVIIKLQQIAGQIEV